MKQYPQRNFAQGVYGDRPEVIQPDAPGKGSLKDGFVTVPPDHFTRMSDDTMQVTAPFRDARAQREYNGQLEEVPWYMSAMAGFMLAPTADIYRRFTKPEFEDDPPVDLFQFLEHTPIVLSPEEHEFMREHGKGINSAKWALSQVKEIRQYRQLAAENPGSAFLGGAADPINLLPVARLGNSLMGRAASAAFYGGLNVGADLAGQTPKSNQDLILSGLMGAVGGGVFGGHALKKAKATDPTADIPTTVHPIREPHIDGDVPFTPDATEPTITGFDGPSRDLVLRRDYNVANPAEEVPWEVVGPEPTSTPALPALPDNGKRAVHDLPTLEQLEHTPPAPEPVKQLGYESHPPRLDPEQPAPVRVPQGPEDFLPEPRLLAYDQPKATLSLDDLVETTSKTEVNRLQRAIASLKALEKRKGLSAQQRRKMTALETKRARLKEGSKVWQEVRRQFELPDPDIAIRQTVEAMQKAVDDPRWAHQQNQRVLREVRRLADLPEVNERPNPSVISMGYEEAKIVPETPKEPVKVDLPTLDDLKPKELSQKPSDGPTKPREPVEPPTVQEAAAMHPEAFDGLPEYVNAADLDDTYTPVKGKDGGMEFVETEQLEKPPTSEGPASKADAPSDDSLKADKWNQPPEYVRTLVDGVVDEAFQQFPDRTLADGRLLIKAKFPRQVQSLMEEVVRRFIPKDIKVLVDTNAPGAAKGMATIGDKSVKISIRAGLSTEELTHVLTHEIGHAIVTLGIKHADEAVHKAFNTLIDDLQKAATQPGNAARALHARIAQSAIPIRFHPRIAEKLGKLGDEHDLSLAGILRDFGVNERVLKYLHDRDELGADLFQKYLMEYLPQYTKPPSYLGHVVQFMKNLLNKLVGLFKTAYKGVPIDSRAADFFDSIAKSIEATGRAGPMDRVLPEHKAQSHQLDLSAIFQQPAQARQNISSKVAKNLAWNMHKAMSSLSDGARKVADLLYDDPLQSGNTSIESLRQGVLTDLREGQVVFEQKLLEVLGKRGAGLAQRVKNSRKAAQIQADLEQEIYMEMVARNEAHATGAQVKHYTQDADVLALADQLDKISAQALGELQRAGVKNAKHLKVTPGFISRQWDSSKLEGAIRGHGEGSYVAVAEMLAKAIQKRTPMIPDDVAMQVAEAIRDRALRKGYFEDSVGAGVPNLVKAKMRDSMRSAGVAEKDVDAAMSVFDEVTAVEGGSGYLKSRIGMDMLLEHQMPDGTILRPVDLVDTNVSSITDTYLKKVATDAGFAQRGLTKPADILKVREYLLREVPEGKRLQMAQQFDDTIAYFKGLPQGVRMNDNFRRAASFGRTITLAASGLWQVTEYASIMARYGLGATTAAMLRHVPGARELFKHSNRYELAKVLTQHSSYNVRLRPFLKKFEDGHSMEALNGIDLKLQQLGDLVPYANGMRFIHHHQAAVVGDLLSRRLEQAITGNKKARRLLEGYGIQPDQWDALVDQHKQHGMHVDNWDDVAWDHVRSPLYRAMDEAVLQSRLGDLPTFAAFDPVGKALFMYRNFVITAHNKLLAGTLERHGAGALGLMFLYQFPLALAATQAQTALMGKEDDKPIATAVAQMGALGLLSEPFKWMTGQSNSVGAPVLIPFDRGVKALQSVKSGDPAEVASRMGDLIPVYAANPVLKAIGARARE